MLYTTFTVKDKEYKARLNTKACVELEKKLGTNPLNVVMEIAGANKLPEVGKMMIILQSALTVYQHGISMDDTYKIYDDFLEEGHTIIDLIPIIIDIFKCSGLIPEEDAEAKN